MTKRVMVAEPYPRHADSKASFRGRVPCLEQCSVTAPSLRCRLHPLTTRQPTKHSIVILREGCTLPLTSVGSDPTSAVGMDSNHTWWYASEQATLPCKRLPFSPQQQSKWMDLHHHRCPPTPYGNLCPLREYADEVRSNQHTVAVHVPSRRVQGLGVATATKPKGEGENRTHAD